MSRGSGLQHASSLGNIEASSKANVNLGGRSYDSEDENMGRARAHSSLPRTSVYSKGDIREQYCLSDRQLSSIEQPRRDGFFGCLSGRGAPQSFLGVCVGRRAPSDENLNDYAPMYKYPRYPPPGSTSNLPMYDEDLDSSYFRRRPTSFLSGGGDAKRYTWMSAADEEAVRLEGPRPICTDVDIVGPYIVGSPAYPIKPSFLSKSSEHLNGSYRCPAHTVPPPPPPPSNVPNDGILNEPPRTKHVSFARSHTLTSFDEASRHHHHHHHPQNPAGQAPVNRPSFNRLGTPTRSHERLIGGKKPTITIPHGAHSILQQNNLQIQTIHQHQAIQQQQQQQQFLIQQQQLQMQQQQDIVVVEKVKRNVMKTQATQTDVQSAKNKQQPPQVANHNLNLSPRTIHRVKMVSQGAQTNGVNNGRKLTKSLSEAATRHAQQTANEKPAPHHHFNLSNMIPRQLQQHEHEPLHRTQSEEPPRSPFEMKPPQLHNVEIHSSRSPSRQSVHTETSRSDIVTSSHHSRNPSQDSAASFRSSEIVSSSKMSQDSVMSFKFSQESNRTDHTYDSGERQYYETHSLPRKSCIHHRQDQFHTHSLPRRDHSHKPCRHNTSGSSEGVNGEEPPQTVIRVEHRICPNQHQVHQHYQQRRMSHSIVKPEIHHIPRRNSVHQSSYHRPIYQDDIFHAHSYVPESQAAPEEQEIFIDFKPKLSPTSPKLRRKCLQKTLSEGEILIEKRKDTNNDGVYPMSQSEEDLIRSNQSNQIDQDRFLYQDKPIKDEGIFHKQSFLSIIPPPQLDTRYKKESFRKRSISLDDQYPDSIGKSTSTGEFSATEELVEKSNFASSDSLSTTDHKDHSDGNWNESQLTVLGREGESIVPGSSLLSPSQKRKTLLRQQRSSVDTECLEMDEAPQKVSQMTQTTTSVVPVLSTQRHSSAGLSVTTNVVRPIQTPSISVTPSHHVKVEDLGTLRRTRNPVQKKVEPMVHSGQRRSSDIVGCEQQPVGQEVVIKGGMVVSNTAIPGAVLASATNNNTDVSECSTNTEDYLTCTDNSKRTSQGIRPLGAISSSAPQVPVSSSQSYHTAIVDGSSFESASSVYSMARTEHHPTGDGDERDDEEGDGEDDEEEEEDEEEEATPTKASQTTKSLVLGRNIKNKSASSSRSSSSSSDTYHNKDLTQQPAPTRHKISPSRTNVVTPIVVKHVAKFESVSDDDDKTETNTTRVRRKYDWNEEERRRKKGNLKLEFEGDAPKTMASPMNKMNSTFKKISPDDRTALNILDGTSPSKSKRFRPKTRRSPRTRSITSEEIAVPRRLKPQSAKSPIQTPAVVPAPQIPPQASAAAPPSANNANISPNLTSSSVKIIPSNYLAQQQPLMVPSQPSALTSQLKQMHLSPGGSPQKPLGCIRSSTSPEKKLKAISTESLRSVSPGSDSVFYSEADLAMEHQVQCHHCGKEVEIVTAGLEPSSLNTAPSTESIDRPEIVQPPAGFADSPNGTVKPGRLYKKVDKRFRSEERHGERRHFRNRSDARAKSEERNKEEANKTPSLRPAGSSPCVVLDEINQREKFLQQQQVDPEQGIYHGFYRLGIWICIANQDVWRRHDGPEGHDRPYELSERRGSTESEKDFRKKYQALTHRLVHRRSCIEMYKRQNSNSFNFSACQGDNEPDSIRGKLEEAMRLMFLVWAKEGLALKVVSGGKTCDTDKTVIVSRDSGEFGFRIHGSKPVVVSAIEPDTPAETSGLEVGDIVLSVNGVSVIDKSHSEVVKIAHAGSDTLELEVARTIDLLSSNSLDNTALYSGYLWRQCGYASCNPAASKKWVRRWFSLRPDHCLYFYKGEYDCQPVGAILLTNHNVERCGNEVSKPFAFKIEDSENPTLFLAGDTEEATSRWVAVMSHAAKQTDPWLDVSTKNLRLAPSDVPRPDCFGYLMKLGNRWRSWTKRYCVLKDACLYFYHDANGRNAFGMTCLQGYRVQPSNNYGGKKFTFEITPPEPKLRHYYFATETEMDKKRWIAALEYSIDRWMKAG